MRMTSRTTPLLALICFAAASSIAPLGAQEAPLLVLSPKANSPGWTGVHRPHTKLRDVLSRHASEADWSETVVDDESLFAQWIAMAPGPMSCVSSESPRMMSAVA